MAVAVVIDAAVMPALAFWCVGVCLCLGLLKHAALSVHLGCHLCDCEYNHESCASQDMPFTPACVVYVLQCCGEEGVGC
jgi:hypothetical protein